MVRIPVKLFTSTETGRVPLYEVHVPDGSPIRHHRFCTAEDVEVPYSEVVKGYEVDDGEYLVLERDEIKAAAADRGKMIEIEEFVEASEIDPAFHDRAYYVGSREDDRAYAVLHEALRRTGRAGIGRFSFHNREYLASIRAEGPVVVLHTLRFHDEVVRPGQIRVTGPDKEPTDRELQLARRLIDSLRDSFDAEEYPDSHRAALMEMIEAKARGEEVSKPAPQRRESTEDLSSALEASLG